MVYLADGRSFFKLRADFLSSLGTAGDDGMAGYNDTTAADNAILYWNSNACWKLCEESESNYKKTNENLKKAMGTSLPCSLSLWFK